MNSFFIGREDEIRSIEACLAEQPSKNISIVGYPGTGKSTLIKELLNKWEKQDRFSSTALIEVSLSSTADEKDLLIKIAEKCYDFLEEKLDNSTKDVIYNMYRDIVISPANTTWIDISRKIRSFFKHLRKYGFGAVVVLNNFDSAITTFTGGKCYNFLADLTNENNVKFITISKRTINEIEILLPGDTVTFNRCFSDPPYPYIICGFFKEKDIEIVINWLKDKGVYLEDSLSQEIIRYSGGCPLIISSITKLLVNKNSNSTPINMLQPDFEAIAIQYNKRLLEELKKQKEIELYLSLCMGKEKIYSINKQKIEKFLRYGIIVNPEGIYRAYSAFFQEQIELATEGIFADYFNNAPSKFSSDFSIYISCANTDSDYLEKFIQQLESLSKQKNIQIWSKKDINAGEKIIDRTNAFIQDSDMVLVLHSMEYNNNCYEEIEEILLRNKFVVPILCRQARLQDIKLHDVKSLPANLSEDELNDKELRNVCQDLIKLINKNFEVLPIRWTGNRLE